MQFLAIFFFTLPFCRCPSLVSSLVSSKKICLHKARPKAHLHDATSNIPCSCSKRAAKNRHKKRKKKKRSPIDMDPSSARNNAAAAVLSPHTAFCSPNPATSPDEPSAAGIACALASGPGRERQARCSAHAIL
ncbi:uncharacterized protein BDZ83DRAFT_229579 [Colletotrichum acutatum]|uniref:Secreted protein n=1 Tax=Glomerella acutata TaxID=27357 RepID=A0AAD8U985_GLOAC|nr:uncharacterized protein BDZ83DRAFT_229579 [Colletotrichum acutatum]KAK1703568.1 hypothetical protein BDZ83DRAFT_229579 [Colletotrichum acutatum]